MHAFDIFIAEKSSLKSYDLFRLRIVSILLCSIGIIPLFIFIGQSLGYCQEEQPILYLLLVIICLAIIKLSNNLNYVLAVFLVLGTYLMYQNVMVTGMAISVNIKWFVFLIAIAAYINHRWMLAYCIMLTVVLFVVKSQTSLPNNSLHSLKFVFETFMNHFLFLVLVAIPCYVTFSYIARKNAEVFEREQLLLEKNKKLMRSNEELERFASNVCHDIKSPLRRMLTFSSLLEKEIGADLSDSGNLYLQHIKEGSFRLHGLVEDILRYAKFDGGTNEFVPVDVNEVIENIKTLIHPNLLDKSPLILVKNKLPIIMGQSGIINLVIKNLIENGIKYNESSSPTVTIRSNVDVNYYNLEIEDNGIGINPAFHKQIFKEFKRLHSYDEYQGTGLGLAICKRAMDYIGGEIEVKSIVGIGSKFILRFPK